MKNIILIINFVLLISFGNAQNLYLDSLNEAFTQAKNDTSRFYTLTFITNFVIYSKPDSALRHARQEILLARKMKSDNHLSYALRDYAGVLSVTGNYPQAIYFELESLKLAEKAGDFNSLAWTYSWLACTYLFAEDFEHALFYARKERALVELYQNLLDDSTKKKLYFNNLYNDAIIGLAMIYDKLDQPDSALKYMRMIIHAGGDNPHRFYLFGNIYFKKGDYLKAIDYYRKGYQFAIDRQIYFEAMFDCNGLAGVFRKMGMPDSSIYYAEKVLEINHYAKYPLGQLEALNLLAGVYDSIGNKDSMVKYLQLAVSTKDSLFNQQKLVQIQNLTFNEQLRQQDIVNEQKAYRDKIKIYILTGGLILLILILISAGLVFFYRYRIKQLEKLQSVKSRIASDLHDDIGATLTNINILAELSKQNFNKTGNTDPYLNRISEEINTTSQALDDIIWSVNVRNDSFDEIILRIRRYAGELFDADKTNYTIQLDEKLSSMKLNMEQRRDLYLLFKESVNNIHKHAAAANVSISITGEDHTIFMKVEDDGKGFCVKKTPRNGLKNLQSRVQKWKGEMRVKTVQGKGTKLFFIFPVK